MRKITQKTVENFKNGKACKISNTKVIVLNGHNEKFGQDYELIRYFLHGNMIGELRNWQDGKKQLFICNCGYETNTTKERLNGILETFGLGYIQQKNRVRYLQTKDKYERMTNNTYAFVL